jgi:hypothetical protein
MWVIKLSAQTEKVIEAHRCVGSVDGKTFTFHNDKGMVIASFTSNSDGSVIEEGRTEVGVRSLFQLPTS